MTTESKCPVVMNGAHRHTAAAGARSNRHWWPNQLNLQILHQNSPLSNAMGKEFNYAKEFKKLDIACPPCPESLSRARVTVPIRFPEITPGRVRRNCRPLGALASLTRATQRYLASRSCRKPSQGRV